jgi:hypothetical protein
MSVKVSRLKKASQTTIGRWNIYESSGFWKACQRINGRVHTIHIGRNFIRLKATAKIAAWESKHLPPGEGSAAGSDLVEENPAGSDLGEESGTAVDTDPVIESGTEEDAPAVGRENFEDSWY